MRLEHDLNNLRRPFQLLVQYVPQGFGWKGMNLPLALWLWLRRNEAPWIMFHEVALSRESSTGLLRRAQAVVTELMARATHASAARVFVSTPAWSDQLTQLTGEEPRAEWLPIPSNVPTEVDALSVAALRTKLLGAGGTHVIGHFGVTNHDGARVIIDTIGGLLETDETRRAVLVGRRSEQTAALVAKRFPRCRGRVFGTGTVSLADVALHLAACEVLVQPYPDGATTRRTSLMAGLALGVPVVTTEGALSEKMWRDSGAVFLAARYEAEELIQACNVLLADSDLRQRLGNSGALLYRREFALEHTLASLRARARTSQLQLGNA